MLQKMYIKKAFLGTGHKNNSFIWQLLTIGTLNIPKKIRLKSFGVFLVAL